jgi:hypothetical protein
MIKIVDTSNTMKKSPYNRIDFKFSLFLKLMRSSFFLLIFLLSSWTIFAQDKPASKTTTQATTAPAKKVEAAPKKEGEDKPLKMESGTVVVDPQSVSSKIKQNNIKHLRKLKSSFLNNGEEQKFNELMKGYVEATITLGEKNYLEARRKFEQNQADMNESVKVLVEKYKETYNKLYQEYSLSVVEMKINGGTDLSNSSYEKMLATGNELKNTAEEQIAKGNHIEALYNLKSAINQLIRIPYFMNKNKNRNLKINERLEKDLVIDEDYIPKEVIKDYDDSNYLIHAERQKDRDKERETIKKSIQTKLGLATSDEKKEEPKPAPAPAKIPEKK